MNTNKEIPEKNIFKAYDIRGVVGKNLNNSSVIQIGKSIGSEALQQKQKSICSCTVMNAQDSTKSTRWHLGLRFL